MGSPGKVMTMKRIALLGILVCLSVVNAAGQVKSSYAKTFYSLGTLCETTADPDAVCPDASWNIDASYNGAAGASAHDEYGLLQAGNSAVLTCQNGCAAGSATSQGFGQAQFADLLTFPGLSGSQQYYLMVTVTVSGAVSGGFLTGPGSVSSVSLGANAQLLDTTNSHPNSSACVIQSILNQGFLGTLAQR